MIDDQTQHPRPRVGRTEHAFLVMNPRSGGGKVARFHLREDAERLGATVLLLEGHTPDLTARLHRAVDEGADLLGVAGGDGSLAQVAAVAAGRDVPLLVIPAGTRNHFALDLGLDRSDPRRSLDALLDGEEIVIDLGMAGERPFVNNVSLGAYAEIVARPDYRDDKLRVTLDVLPQVLSGREQQHFTVRTGEVSVTDPTAALISNNPYRPGDIRRPHLDGGTLGLLCVQVQPPQPPHRLAPSHEPYPPVVTSTAEQVMVECPVSSMAAAIDGESVILPMPLRCQVRPRSLRVRVPRRHAPPAPPR